MGFSTLVMQGAALKRTQGIKLEVFIRQGQQEVINSFWHIVYCLLCCFFFRSDESTYRTFTTWINQIRAKQGMSWCLLSSWTLAALYAIRAKHAQVSPTEIDAKYDLTLFSLRKLNETVLPIIKSRIQYSEVPSHSTHKEQPPGSLFYSLQHFFGQL